jgi:glycyl-tRNA synthetase beta chain
MVYEFPELQGIMGGYYAAHDGLGPQVGAAIRDHYKPLGPGDAVPATAEGCVVALADKIDSLTGFWSIDEKPTGSKDPYALRRAALGLIRILHETQTRLSLKPVFEQALALHGASDAQNLADDLMGFVGDRLKVFLRDRGINHDVVSAIFADGNDDVVALIGRAEKLADFLATDDGRNLLAAYRRADGICAKAEGLDGTVNVALLVEQSETALHQAVAAIETTAFDDVAAYEAYLNNLAVLRQPVDGFFEAVMVNDENVEIRQNRLNLLHALVHKMRFAAAFELIE